jgi:transcriptional regulator with XRE-family HTH domain
VYEESKQSDKNFIIALGKKIREKRLRKKISKTEIAYRCSFDKINYNTIESDKRNITVLSLLKTAKTLEVSILDLLNI